MRNLLTRLLILLVLLFVYRPEFRGGIYENTFLLLVMICSLLFSYFPPGTRPWRAVLWFSVTVLACLSRTFAHFLPLFVFDAVIERLHAQTNHLLEKEMYGFERASLYAPFLILLPLLLNFQPGQLLFCVLSATLGWYAYHLDEVQSKLHRVRDDLEEKLLRLHTDLRQRRLQEEKERHMTRLNERDRISRELHDVTGHTLSSALLQVGALKVINREPGLEKPLEQLHETLNSGMSDIRSALHDMHAESCDLELELNTILRAATSFETRLSCRAPENLTLQMKLDLIAIAREAVTNAMRYSQGKRLEINLLNQPSLLSLSIWDDGEDFDPENVQEGMGISNIRSIVERNRGLLNLTRVPGKGFTVHAVFMKEKE